MKPAAYILILVAFAVDCSAQGLAEIARRERERRQKQVHSTVIIANGVTTTTAASTASTATSPVIAPAVPKDNQGHDEKYWRALFQKARDEVKAAEDKVQLLDLKVKDLNTQLLRQSDIYNRENVLGPQIAEAQKQLDEARANVDQAKKKLSDLEDDLRRAGGPAGWAR